MASTVALAAQSVAPEPVGEYPMKAEILYNLAKFVDWPAETFPQSSTPLSICVLGADPFGPVLDDALRGAFVGGRPVVPRRVADIDPACHVLFLAASETKQLALVADRARTMSILTVGEEEDFIDQGGMIALTTEGRHVRFVINSDRAERAGLKLSARLMTLASSVRKSEDSAR